MKIVPYDPNLNSVYIQDAMNAMSDEEQQEMTSQYGVIAMWSFIDDNEALAVLGAFSTDREDEMYFSLIADDKIKSDHGFWLARTLRKTFQKTYDLAQYSVATMHCDVGDPIAARFAEWLGFKPISHEHGKTLYEQTI